MFKLRGHRTPPPEKEPITFKEVLSRKYRDCSSLRLYVNGAAMDELLFMINKDFIVLDVLGSFEKYFDYSTWIGESHSLAIYSTEINMNIKELGKKKLINVEIEAPDRKRLKVTLKWEQ